VIKSGHATTNVSPGRRLSTRPLLDSPIWGDSIQPLLYDYNEYGERVAMRTFQTTPEGDPSHVEDTGAKTAWHFHEATGSLLRKEYADGKGPEYAYNEAGQLASRVWAREGAVSGLAVSGLAVSGLAGSGLAGSGLAGSGLAVSGLAVSGLAVSGLASDQDLNPGASVTGKQNSKTANGSERTFKIATSYSYDPATLQLATSTATDGTVVAYEYDSDGRLAKVTDATGTREFAYDLRGQVTKETVVLQHDPAGDPAGDPAKADPIHYEIRRTYTKLGQPESVHLVSPDGQSVALDHRIDYAWNEHSQLASVKSLAGEFAYGYDEANPALLTKMTGPVHEVETSYEPHRNLVTGVVNKAKPDTEPGTKHEEPSTLSSYTYANDLLGRRETISQGGEGFGMLKLGQNKVEVAYNDRSEVTGAVYRSNTETRQNFEYTYDAIGNRLKARSAGGQSAVGGGQSAEIRYETNALNQYKKISENQRQLAVPYDLDGNLLEDARNTYTWNADNNLIRVDAKDGTLRLDYVYDHQSRRTVRVETSNRGRENEEQRTTYYLYDAWNLLAEIHAVPAGGELGTLNFEPATLFSWGRDLSGSLHGAGGVGGLLAISKGNPGAEKPGGAQPEPSARDRRSQTSNLKLETLFPTYDANGNIGQLIDESGSVVAAYAYDPFGNVTEMAGAEAAENPWRFSTKPVEAGTGWLYYGYRWLDAEIGRWVNRDPIEESGGVNLYGFVGNASLHSIDYLGQSVVDAEITLTRVSKDPYGTYGTLTLKVNEPTSEEEKRCCPPALESTYKTIELPEGAQNPQFNKTTGEFERYYTGLFTEKSGNAFLKNPSDTTVSKMASRYNLSPPMPEGEDHEDWQNIVNYAVSTGIGGINIHMGHNSLGSGGCILVGSSYIDRDFVIPVPGYFPRLNAGVRYTAPGFDLNDSLSVQYQITSTLYHQEKCRKRKLNIKFRVAG
jgi:RHS repeat-associated protein